jgi:hypothetical protein
MRLTLGKGCVAALASLVWLGGSAAGALTLDDLANGGQSFVSGNGALTFSGFDVTASSGLDPDLRKYAVKVIDDGFELRGPINAADGEQDDLFIAYSVATSSEIGSASVFFNGQAMPAKAGVAASVTDDYFQGETHLGSIFVARTGGGIDQPSGALTLGSPVNSLRVEKDILVDSRAADAGEAPAPAGSIASISLVRQQFAVGGATVPEPTATLLLGCGLAGLAVVGRSRR